MIGRLAEPEEEAVLYGSYVHTQVNGRNVLALIDSGNLWRSAISEEFAARLGIDCSDLRRLEIDSISTAKEGARLDVLGETPRALQVSFGSSGKLFRFKPIVIRGLTMSVNVSGPFLQSNDIDQLHSKGMLRVAGREIKFVNGNGKPVKQTVCSMSAPAYVTRAVCIPAYSWGEFPVHLAAIHDGGFPEGEGMLVGEDAFMHKTGLHPYRRQVVTDIQQGYMAAGALNMTAEEVTIPAGQKYGMFALLPAYPDPNKVNDAASQQKKWSRSKKEEWLAEEFELNKNPLLSSKDRMVQVLEMLCKHWEIYSTDGSFGRTELIQHDIHTEAVPPVKLRYRPLNPKLEKNLKEQLEEWLKHDVVEESNSPWSFALVAVKKKNGKIRWCVDYRKLNDITKKDAFPLPFIEDNLARLADSKIFSAVDGMGAFHVVELTEDAKPKTAFATPWGTYHFKRMPFGLSNGPATYSRLMQMALQGIPTTVALPYLDDTIIHAATFEEHLLNLDAVLAAHARAGLKLQPSKCKLFREETEYLGHLVSKEGIRPVPEYTEIVRKWPLPRTVTQVRAFLGKIGYYRRFLKDFARRARPWTDAIKDTEGEDGNKDSNKNREVPVTSEMETAFQDLREALTTAPILAYPRFDDESMFILDTDWSQDSGAIGAVLSQVQVNESGSKIEKVISYAAKKLNAGQLNYPPTKGELFAAITFMKHWHYYLSFQPFILRTDHQALTWIRTMERPTGMILRWLETLATFEFTVQHRAGTKHGNADALSRIDHAPPLQADEDDDEVVNALCALGDADKAERLCTLRYQSQDVNYFHRENSHVLAFLQELKEESKMPVDVEDWRREQEADADLSEVRAWLSEDCWPGNEEIRSHSTEARYYFDRRELLFLDDSHLLRYSDPLRKESKKGVLCIPAQLQREVVWAAHRLAGHRGTMATAERVLSHAHFPGIVKLVREMVQHCEACQRKGGGRKDQRHTLASVTDGYPFQRLSLDFVGPLPRSTKGHFYLLTIKDTFTRWVEAFPLTSATAEAVALKLERELFPRFGYPESIHSDQGAQFTGNIMNQLCKELDLVLTHTPAYNPKSNPVERAHRDMKAAFKALYETGKDWEDLLPHVLFALRTTVCVSTGYSPFQLMFGRDPSVPLLALQQMPERKEAEIPLEKYMQKYRERVRLAQQFARANIEGAVRRQRRYYRRTVKDFQEGDLVWLYTPAIAAGESRKFHKGWTGPWTIQGRVTQTVYLLHPASGWFFKKPVVISGDRLKPFFQPEERSEAYEPPRDATVEDLQLHGNEDLEEVDLVTPDAPRQRQAPGESDESEEEGDTGGRRKRYPPRSAPRPAERLVVRGRLPPGPARVPAPVCPPPSSRWYWGRKFDHQAGPDRPVVELPERRRNLDASWDASTPRRVGLPPGGGVRPGSEEASLRRQRASTWRSFPTLGEEISAPREAPREERSWEPAHISRELEADSSDSSEDEENARAPPMLRKLTTSTGWQHAQGPSGQSPGGNLGRRSAAVRGEVARREASGITSPTAAAQEGM